MHQAGLDARRAQYALVGTPQAFGIARILVAAKIANMRGLVRRRARLAGRQCLALLQRQTRQARIALTLETLLGIEGAATAQYFAAWPTMISVRSGGVTLRTRTRRPPEDEGETRCSPIATRSWPGRMPLRLCSQRARCPARIFAWTTSGSAGVGARPDGAVPSADRRSRSFLVPSTMCQPETEPFSPVLTWCRALDRKRVADIRTP